MAVIGEAKHDGGVPWWEAKVPHRWHRCKPQTTGATSGLGLVQRCACGAIRFGADPFWLQRNSTRKARKRMAARRGNG
jgi:hypothetical protein